MRLALVAVLGILLQGCAHTTSVPVRSPGVIFVGPAGTQISVNGRAIGVISAEGLPYIHNQGPLLIDAYCEGYTPVHLKLQSPSARIELSLVRSNNYLSDILAQEHIRFVLRAGVLMLEPANRVVTLRSSYRVYVPRRQSDVVLYVSEISQLFVTLTSDEGDIVTMPIIRP